MLQSKNEQARKLPPVTERPLAAAGLISYRAACPYGWIMIGAHDDADALVQARRSSSMVEASDLQVWNGTAYVSCELVDAPAADDLEADAPSPAG